MRKFNRVKLIAFGKLPQPSNAVKEDEPTYEDLVEMCSKLTAELERIHGMSQYLQTVADKSNAVMDLLVLQDKDGKNAINIQTDEGLDEIVRHSIWALHASLYNGAAPAPICITGTIH